MPIETIGGQPTVAESYMKLLHHLDEARECCAVISHLIRTEDARKDKLLAKGWLGISELLLRMRHQITKLAQGRLN